MDPMRRRREWEKNFALAYRDAMHFASLLSMRPQALCPSSMPMMDGFVTSLLAMTRVMRSSDLHLKLTSPWRL